MRDINRIEPLLNKFEELWKSCPDIRFGQMVYNIVIAKGSDIFNIEDDKMLLLIEEFDQKYGYTKKEGNNV